MGAERDVFLHRNFVNSVPSVGDAVEFDLTVDAKGQPKATNAIIVNGKGAQKQAKGGRLVAGPSHMPASKGR
ncbi:ANKRD17 [Symbiodinium natans]|uniref:ANKRD17 protein n=1 Tax=Symbiodinium natans TaxID=878477 RepID=A0A812J882_9DINO|nr:ANKRD17 [Symbiodinium natans]